MTKLETQLLDLSLSLPDPVHFKTTDTGQYIFSNSQCAQLLGVATPTDMLGLTVQDLDFARSQSTLAQAWAANIEQLDKRVRTDRVRVTDAGTFFKPNGLLILNGVTKIPIKSANGNVIAIATIGQDLTYKLSNALLFERYVLMCGKKLAPAKLLQHLGLASWFCVAPTYTEMKMLLDRAAGDPDKTIAQRHRVSVRTVETHMANLRGKLMGDTMPQILAAMRHSAGNTHPAEPLT